MEQNKLTPLQVYNIGDIIEFKVKSLFNNYCELLDENTAITSYLQGTAKLILFKGQIVKCRILAINEKHPKIELVDIKDFEQSNDNLTEEKLAKLLESREISWNTKEFIKLLLLVEEKDKTFESQCHKWIQALLNKKIDLQIVRKDCSDLLELSELLNICSSNERDFYQERLTMLIEQMSYYIRATDIITNETIEMADNTETPTRFINNLFNKLRISGFVYHPNKNFHILSCLFLLKPDLMNSRIKELLDIISEKKIQIWEKEPFSSALIKLLELYIKESDGRIFRTKDNKALIENNILALAIQLLLIKDSNNSNIADYHLNAAKLCVLSSYLYPSDPESLVKAAYYILFNPNLKLPPYTIDKVKILPHYISGSTKERNIDTINSFSQGNGRLVISKNGIYLQPAGEHRNLYPVFPQEMKLWNNLQIFLSSKPDTSLTSIKANDLTPYQLIWSEIEAEFFNSMKRPAVTTNRNQKRHRIDEIVNITFTGQDVKDRNKYYCQIEDEIGGCGVIFVSDIVPYAITTSLRHFYASDGSRYVFSAQIIDKIEDDLFRFSMKEDLKNCFSNYYTSDEEIICSLGSTPNSYGMAPAITKEGVSVSIINAGDFEGVEKNTIVRCRQISVGSGTFHINCEMVDFASTDFDLNTAFKKLMEEYSVGKIPENITQQEEEQILESDKLIDESYVKEVIYMIDRIALIDKEYAKSFNYLGFARVLSLLIGWESQATYYKGRMDIIAMLHDFAINSKVDEEKVKKLEKENAELFSNNHVLRERFLQLQTVSFLNKDEHNADLFKLINTNPTLKNLASLVLAYNITKSNGLETSATDIHNKIIQQLNLKGNEIGLKLYGDGIEDEETEYKTSIVYTEDNAFQPNQDKQMNEILKVINSFFNTKGGTLYIGVNNFGYGVGVDEDLKSPIYYGDKDKYIRSVIDAVALKWGNDIATTYIKDISFDKENPNKDVLKVEISPIQSGLAYNGFWYVRKGGSKRKLTESEFDKYQKVSRNLQETDKKENISEEIPKSNPETTDNAFKPFAELQNDSIRTSRIRKNVLKEWEDPENYVEPIGLFKFLSNGKFKKINKYDFDDKNPLTLVVKEHEKKSFLILGYENGHIVKVPVEELLAYSNREYSRNTDSKLIFSSIGGKEDAIITISKEDKAHPKVLMRLDYLSRLGEGKLMDGGTMLYNEGLAREILAFDIIPYKYIKDFKSILDRPKTTLGLPKNDVTKDIVNRLHLWGIIEI